MSPKTVPLKAKDLNGPQKCAVLCVALGAKGAAKILQQLAPEEVERVAREIAGLTAVDSELVRQVVQEFQNVSQAVESVSRGGIDYARQVLEQSFGPGRAQSVLEKIQSPARDGGFRRLRQASPETLAGILRPEHPQTLALILAHLDPEHATRVAAALDPAVAADVLFRIARMEKIAPEMVALVEQGLSSKTDLSLSQEMTESGGPAAVAKLLNLGGEALEKPVLEAIAQRDPDVAGKIRSLMFVFEDLVLVDGKGMQRILREVDAKDLALAMKAASEELKRHITSNMSERAAAALEEEIEILGPVRVKEVEAVHATIIETVRGLEQAGDIMIRGRGGDDDVI